LKLSLRDKQIRAIIRLLRAIRDALRDLVTLQQQQVDLYRALVSGEDGGDWKPKP
jgi:hypothetical protein